MKEYDQVKLVRDRESYAKKGIHKGMTGFVMEFGSEGKKLVSFTNEFLDPNGVLHITDIECTVLEKDMEIISEA